MGRARAPDLGLITAPTLSGVEHSDRQLSLSAVHDLITAPTLSGVEHTYKSLAKRVLLF